MPAELIVVTAADVSAFVDGELAPEERRDVAACARDDERVALLVAAWRWQLRLIHIAFGRDCEKPLPDRLTGIVRRHPVSAGGPRPKPRKANPRRPDHRARR